MAEKVIQLIDWMIIRISMEEMIDHKFLHAEKKFEAGIF
jgi:hypothetical protein